TRMVNYETTRKAAIEEARAGGTPDELAVLEPLLAKEPQSFQGFDMTGNWQCRTIKAGGLLPLVVYGWVKWKVTDDGCGWVLEKTSGSQRTKGRLYDVDDKRLAYLGSYFASGDTPKPYGSGKDTDQFAYVFRTGPKSFRMEFPGPAFESHLDVIE